MSRLPYLSLFALVLAAPAAAQTCNPNQLAATPTGRFVVNGDGTVADSRTRLIWKRCPEGLSGAVCGQGSPLYLTWEGALKRARDSTYAGQSDWRLPNIKELASIVENRCYDPAINPSVFPNTPSEWFWSSSPYADYSSRAWIVYFYDGGGVNDYRDDGYAVRLVRGGQ